MTRVLLISTGLPEILEEIVRQALGDHADIQLDVRDAAELASAVRETDADVVIGTENQLPGAEVCALLDGFPRSRVFTLTTDARMAWLYELRPERVALGELSPLRLAEVIRTPRLRVCEVRG